MNKEYLENRIKDLQEKMKHTEQMINQFTANANACMGAIQECQIQLAKLSESENSDSSDEKSDAAQ